MGAFVVNGSGHWAKIVCECGISSPPTRRVEVPEIKRGLKAQWDTGATVTCVSESVVEELHLHKSGVTTIMGIDGKPRQVNTYMINIYLPDEVSVCYIEAACVTMPIIDVLIGMDVISDCDFHYTIKEGKSCFRVETFV